MFAVNFPFIKKHLRYMLIWQKKLSDVLSAPESAFEFVKDRTFAQ